MDKKNDEIITVDITEYGEPQPSDSRLFVENRGGKNITLYGNTSGFLWLGKVLLRLALLDFKTGHHIHLDPDDLVMTNSETFTIILDKKLK
jgi:hypothetical protein